MLSGTGASVPVPYSGCTTAEPQPGSRADLREKPRRPLSSTLDAAMTDEEYLEAQRKARAESVEFFRSGNKPERERWVAHEYLTNLGVSFTDEELVSSPQDPPDVLFRGANFEIKEILSEGRRRHQEYKEGLQKSLEAMTPADLLEHFTPRDISIAGVCALICNEATALAKEKYTTIAVRKSLDLLFYVNLSDVFGLVEAPFPELTALESLGYRSVAFVMGYRSSTLAAKGDAPSFITGPLSQIAHRKLNDDAASNL